MKNWNELKGQGMPAGFADDIDNVGITAEENPQVGDNTPNYVPRWDGSALVTGTIFDNGNIGIGMESPGPGLRLEVNGSAKIDASCYIVDRLGIGTESPVAKLDIMRSEAGTQLLSLRDLLGGSFGIDLQGVGLSSQAAFKRSSGGAPLIEVMSIPLDGANAGNVGIGTASPGAKLEVVGGAAAGLNINRDGGQLKLSGGAYHGGLWTSGGNLYLGNWDTSAGAAVDLANGNVGIGTASPEDKLDVNGSAVVRGSVHIYGGDNGIRTYINGEVVSALIMHAYALGTPKVVLVPDEYGFRITDHANEIINFDFSNDGDFYYRKSISGPSDARLKFNEQPLEYGLAQILALQPKRYQLADWSVNEETEEIVVHPESTRNTIGLVAQEVNPIIPDAVRVPEDDTKEVWSISYQTIIPVLIKAIHEQQAQIEELKKEKQALESGNLTDTPLTADFDGDGKTDRALVSANGDWYFWLSGSGFVKSGPHNFGVAGKPAVGDFDGDGKADPGIVSADGGWYVWLSGSGYSQSKL